LLDREKPLLHAHFAVPLAGRTGLGLTAGGRTAALAGITAHLGGDADFPLHPLDGLFERDLHAVSQIRTTKGPGPAPAAAEDIAKDIAKDIREVGTAKAARPAGAAATAAAGLDTGMAELIIGGPLLRVA
jgi:hypothetical protein